MAAMISGINKTAGVFESIAPRTFLVWRFFQAGITSRTARTNPARGAATRRSGARADRIRLLPSGALRDPPARKAPRRWSSVRCGSNP